MTALPKRRFSEEEYLLIERAAEYKSEYWDGEMYAMAGAASRHGLISWNIGSVLHAQFRARRCAAYLSDMRVRVASGGMYTYPDIAAVCGEPRFLDARRDTLLNPQLLVEVLSPSTEAYDRGEKLRRYRQLESLTDCLLVSQDRMLVEHWSRDAAVPHVWTHLEYAQKADRIHFVLIDAALTLDEIYDRADFSDVDPSPSR